MRSLRLRVTLGVLLGQFVLLSAGTAIAYRSGREVITAQFDEAMIAKAATFESLIEQEGDRLRVEHVDGLLPEYEREDEPEYFQIWWGDSVVVARAPSLDGGDLLPLEGHLDLGQGWNEVLPDGRPGRAIATSLTVHDVEEDEDTGVMPAPAELLLVMAKSREDLDRLASLLLGGLLAGAALLGLCGFGLTWWGVGVCLAPIRAFGRRVADVDVHTLAVPLPGAEFPKELDPVVTALNDLLQRLDMALRAERRTASNVAHELKTPISELRALADIALQAESSPAYRERALGHAREIALQLENLIGMVRQLTHIDAHVGLLPGTEVPIAPVFERVEAAVRERADAKGLDLEVDVNGAAIHCDRDALFSVCNNLVGNAVEYAPAGTRVRFLGHSEGERIRIRVDNDCGELGEADLEHLTEPFWRHSAARTEADHHGLGLTIAQGMARLAGIDLAFRLENGRFVAEATAPAHRN